VRKRKKKIGNKQWGKIAEEAEKFSLLLRVPEREGEESHEKAMGGTAKTAKKTKEGRGKLLRERGGIRTEEEKSPRGVLPNQVRPEEGNSDKHKRMPKRTRRFAFLTGKEGEVQLRKQKQGKRNNRKKPTLHEGKGGRHRRDLGKNIQKKKGWV